MRAISGSSAWTPSWILETFASLDNKFPERIADEVLITMRDPLPSSGLVCDLSAVYPSFSGLD